MARQSSSQVDPGHQILSPKCVCFSYPRDGTITTYLNGQGISEHLGEVKNGVGKAYVTDHQQSVLNGEPAGSSHMFGLMGEVYANVILTPNSSPIMYGWQGLSYDAATKNWDNLARQYDQNTGTFTTQDPIGFASGELNLYRSRNGNPLIYVDPLGLDTYGPGIPPEMARRYLQSSEGQEAFAGNFGSSESQPYRYVEENGVLIDLRHVSGAYNQTRRLMDSGVNACVAGGITYGLGVGLEIDQALGGRISGASQASYGDPRTSAFSPEDIPSNVLGIEAAKRGLRPGGIP